MMVLMTKVRQPLKMVASKETIVFIEVEKGSCGSGLLLETAKVTMIAARLAKTPKQARASGHQAEMYQDHDGQPRDPALGSCSVEADL
jgi:hypothetical protein